CGFNFPACTPVRFCAQSRDQKQRIPSSISEGRFMTPRSRTAVAEWTGSTSSTPLASWYTESLCDAIGDRLFMFDNSGTPSLELLRFRQEFGAASGFEDALRERVDALHAFDHPAFSQVRAVERLDSGDLVLVSTFTTGKRLS